MLVSFVSDIHLNLRGDSSWASSRFLSLFKLLAENKSETIILGGDIFDLSKVSLDELKVFYDGIKLLTDVNKEVIVISGNHENLSDNKTVFDFIPHVGFTYYEDELVKLDGYDLYFVSHLKCKEIINKKKDISKRKSILFSHFRANFGTFIKGEIDVAEVSKMFDHCFVGDIHHTHTPYPNVTYPSSPYSIHFDIPRDFGYFVIDLGSTFSYHWERLDLPCKILQKVSSSDVLQGLQLEDSNRYKVVIEDFPNTEVSAKLMKNKLVDNFEFKPKEIKNTDEFEELVTDLSSHKGEEVIDMLLLLLKTNEYPLELSDENYLKELLKDVRN